MYIKGILLTRISLLHIVQGLLRYLHVDTIIR